MELNIAYTGLRAPDFADVLPAGGSGKLSGFPRPKAEAVLPQKKNAQEQIVFDRKDTEKTRLENMKQASQAMFRDVFVVSDTKFAIYKDASGQFITRFTNLRDGSVSYIPEPDMLQYLESRGNARKALLKLDV